MRIRTVTARANRAGIDFWFPVVVVQADPFNRSRIPTVLAVPLSANLRLAQAPGNVRVAGSVSGLPRDSVANVSQLVTVDRGQLKGRVKRLPASFIFAIDRGLRLVLDL